MLDNLFGRPERRTEIRQRDGRQSFQGIIAKVSDTLAQEVVGAGFDRIYRINRIEGRREERGRRGNHAESAEGKGNSDGWKATLTLRRTMVQH